MLKKKKKEEVKFVPTPRTEWRKIKSEKKKKVVTPSHLIVDKDNLIVLPMLRNYGKILRMNRKSWN